MYTLRRISPIAPLAGLVFALAFVTFEYFNGGVKTHHFLARADLPGFSNWLTLLVLPVLGVALAVRVAIEGGRNTSGATTQQLAAGAAGSLMYGGALAASFLFGLEQLSLVLFLGLFLCAVTVPVYRAEYIFGFVAGMTIAFGSVIPLFFAVVFATISFAVRRAGAYVIAKVRKSRR
jgi:hypothetical protein